MAAQEHLMQNAPLTSPTPDQITGSASANLHALFRAMSALEGGRLEEVGAVSRHLSFPTNPMFKGAWATHLPPGDEDAIIEETIAWFRDQGAPFFFWWRDPGCTPADLGARLMARGLISMEGQARELAHGIVQASTGAPVMVMDLGMGDEDMPHRVPSGYEMRLVESEADLLAFKQVFVTTYEIPDWAGQAWVDATLAFGIPDAPWRIFLGWLDGEPVASNLLFNGGGFASVYAIATTPPARGKGIGAAITLAPLMIARAEGWRYATLFSTEMGMPVYRRIGFADTGARLDRYLWRAG
jgi:GNAT superfamily N-acetyltransferase